MNGPRVRALVLATLTVGGLQVGIPSAEGGTFPGANGRIAFSSGDLELIAEEGSGRANLTPGSFGAEDQPAWNAAGTRLAFITADHTVNTIDADGSNATALFAADSFAGNPTWAPDGSVIAFDKYVDALQGRRIYVVAPSGGDATQIGPASAQDPSYSPDGTRIAFEANLGADDIALMNADGTNVVNLAPSDDDDVDQDPSWSPDGTKIAFARNGQIWTMGADGTGAIQLTSLTFDAEHPSWSPDGTKIAFAANDDIWIMAADGTDQTNMTDSASIEERDPDWGACAGSNCPAGIAAPTDRTYPEPEDRLRVALRITLTRITNQPVTVRWAYRDGTATIASGDYEAATTSGSVTIPAGERSTGDLPYSFIVGDGATEPDEYYALELTAATNAPIADYRTVITILGVAGTCP
ncbi:MAG: hypothetical protein ACRDKT_00210, partial [Actinomycetota bacterium]